MEQREKTDIFLNDLESVLEYRYHDLASSKFSYHKHPDPKHKGKYLDDGTCEICGKKKTYLLIDKDKPKMCYKCYQSIRAYQNLLVDVLKLKKKKTLNIKDCKRIVKYMRTYAKKKALALGVLATVLAVSTEYDLKK